MTLPASFFHSPLPFPSSLLLLLLVLLFTSSSHLPSLSSLNPTCDALSVSCKTCDDSSISSGQRLGDLSGVPRVDGYFKGVSNDLGSYDFYTCDPVSGDCTTYSPNLSNIYKRTYTDDRDPTIFVDSYAAYVIFGLCMVLIVTVFGLCLFLWRYCCCCCGRGGYCGNRYPTKKNCCGFGSLPDPETELMYYPPKARWAARIYMWIFVFFMFLWIGLGYFSGTKTAPDSAKDVSASPSALANLIQGTAPTLVNTIIAITSTIVIPTLVTTTNLINSAADLKATIVDINCGINSIDSLPPLSQPYNFLVSVQSSLGSVVSLLNSDIPLIQSDINNKTQYVTNQLNTISSNITQISNTLTQVTATLNGTQSTLNTVAAAQNNFTVQTNSIIADLLTINNLPTTSSAETAAGDDAPLVNDPGTGTNGNTVSEAVSQLNTLKTELLNINSSLSSVINFNSTADKVVSLNNFIASVVAQHLADNALASLATVNVQEASIITRIVGINNTINSIISYIANFDLNYERGLLIAVNSSIQSIPSFTANIDPDINAVYGLQVGINCLNNTIPAISTINNTLISLPTQVSQLPATIASLNSTLQSALTYVSSIQSQVNTFENQRIQYGNLTSYFNQINQQETSIRQQANAFNTNSLIQQYINIVNSNTLNFTQLTSEITALNTTVNNSTIPQGDIDQLRNFTNVIGPLKSFISSFIVDLESTLATGLCADITLTCLKDSDCGPSPPCTFDSSAHRRCSQSVTTPCHQDSQCGGSPNYCLTGNEQAATMYALLYEYGNNYPASSIAQINSLSSQLNHSANSVEIANAQSSIQSAIASVQQSNTSSFQSQITSALNQLTIFNISALTSTISNLNNSIQTIDFNSLYNNINQLNSSYQTVYSNNHTIQQAKTALFTIDDFINNQLPVTYIPNLSSANLESQNQQGGIAQLILYISQQADDMNAYLVTQSNQFGASGFNFNVDAVSNTATARDYLSRTFTNENLQYGGIYYFLALMNTNMIQGSDPLQGRYDHDAFGNQYLNGYKCYTQLCLDNTVTYYSNAPVSDYTPASISQTAQNLNGLLYLIPTFIALLALSSTLCWKSYALSNWLASATACCILAWLPLFFLISTLFFIFALGMGDICYGGANVGQQYLLNNIQKTCTSTIGGTGDITNCTITQNSFTFDVSVLGIYRDVIGGCGATGGTDYIQSAFVSVQNSFNTYPITQTNDFLNNNFGPTSNYQMRPTLRNVFTTAAGNSVPIVNSFISSFGSAVGCAAVHQSYLGFKTPLCCNVGGSLYWALCSWYLISWSMWYCGCGAALLGRKRFANQIPAEHQRELLLKFDPDGVLPDDDGMSGGGGGGAEPQEDWSSNPISPSPIIVMGSPGGRSGAVQLTEMPVSNAASMSAMGEEQAHLSSPEGEGEPSPMYSPPQYNDHGGEVRSIDVSPAPVIVYGNNNYNNDDHDDYGHQNSDPIAVSGSHRHNQSDGGDALAAFNAASASLMVQNHGDDDHFPPPPPPAHNFDDDHQYED